MFLFFTLWDCTVSFYLILFEIEAECSSTISGSLAEPGLGDGGKGGLWMGDDRQP